MCECMSATCSVTTQQPSAPNLSTPVDASVLSCVPLCCAACLQGAVDISVASPDKAVALGPFIETLKAVKGLLDALQTALIGPQGGVLAVLDTAVQAATGLAESAGTAAAGAVATAANAIPAALSSLGLGDVSTLTSLVQTAQGLLSKLGL